MYGSSTWCLPMPAFNTVNTPAVVLPVEFPSLSQFGSLFEPIFLLEVPWQESACPDLRANHVNCQGGFVGAYGQSRCKGVQTQLPHGSVGCLQPHSVADMASAASLRFIFQRDRLRKPCLGLIVPFDEIKPEMYCSFPGCIQPCQILAFGRYIGVVEEASYLVSFRDKHICCASPTDAAADMQQDLHEDAIRTIRISWP